MLIAAACCIGFAVFLMLDMRPPIQASAAYNTEPPLNLTFEESPHFYESEAVVETASWVHVVPPEVIIPPPYPTLEPTPRPSAPSVAEEYTFLPFYIHENAVLYAEFRQERPDLDTETIIWKVNASVHVPFFSQININHDPNPLFISPAYRLPDGFSPPLLVSVNNDDCHLLAKPEVVDAFREFRRASQAAGFDLSVTSAFRTAARQSELWENGGQRDGSVARPYHSEHQTGRALDLWGPGGLLDASGPSPTGKWVAENAHNYGFIIRYRAETTHITGYIHEPWHITYVGTRNFCEHARK
jgi:hypothetical protein